MVDNLNATFKINPFICLYIKHWNDYSILMLILTFLKRMCKDSNDQKVSNKGSNILRVYLQL